MRKLTFAIVLILLILVMIAAKVHLSGVKEYKEAKVLLAAGDNWSAIHSLDRVLNWYTPFSGYVQNAANDLWSIGQAAEKSGNLEQALVAYRTLRSGFYGARSFYTPGQDWIARCDERIVVLAARQPDYVERHPELDEQALQERVRQSLTKDQAPDVFWSLIVEIGFLGWVGCLIGLIWFVLGSAEGWRRRPAAVWGLFVIVFYTLWIVGMMRA